MAAEETSKIWELPCKSQEFQAPPSLTQRGDRLELTYDFETESGQYQHATISFRGVESFSFTSFESCSPDQVAAYDEVVVVCASKWLKQLRSRRASEESLARHYRIFLDEVGCYEVVASEFSPPDHPG